MGLFNNKYEDKEVENLIKLIKRNPEIDEDNKEILINQLNEINIEEETEKKKKTLTFINLIATNPNYYKKDYQVVINDAIEVYNSLSSTQNSLFFLRFLKVFDRGGLYESGLYGTDVMGVFEYPENYFSIMEIISKNEQYRTNYPKLKKLIMALAIYTPNDIELRTMLLNFLTEQTFSGNLDESINNYIKLAKKRAGIYDDLGEDYLVKMEALINKAKRVFDLSQGEEEKLKGIHNTIIEMRSNFEKFVATYDAAVKNADSSMQLMTDKYASRLDQCYTEQYGKLRNDYIELLKRLSDSADTKAQELAREALKQMESDAASLAKTKDKYESLSNEHILEISKIKEEAIREVRQGLEDIRSTITSSGMKSEDLKQLSSMLKEIGSTNPQIIVPNQKEIIVPKQQIVMSNSASGSQSVIMDSSFDECPEVIPCLDRNIKFKKRFQEALEAKKRKEESGVVYHKSTDDVLYYLLKGDVPYLYGPSGSGKSFFVKQIADLIGIKTVNIGYINEEYELLGGKNAYGEYSPSIFYYCWKNGYLAFGDELDNGVQQATLKLNAFMSRDKESTYCFPVVGFVPRHPNFRMIAAGNTKGMGATRAHNIRSKFDESMQQRLTFIPFDYDKQVESSLLSGYPEWRQFIDLYRDAVVSFFDNVSEDVMGQLTTRDISAIVEDLADGVSSEEQILKYQFVEAKDADYLAHVVGYMQRHENEYNMGEKGKKLVRKFSDLCNHHE